MMTTFGGGTQVQSGYYWNAGKWEMVPVERSGDALPGSRSDRYLRIPLPLVFLLLPLMGGLFVVFLPFIGFALTAQAAALPIVGLFRRSAQDLAATVTPGWQPGEAHFTGKRAEGAEAEEEKKVPAAAEGGALDQLQREIDEKRKANR